MNLGKVLYLDDDKSLTTSFSILVKLEKVAEVVTFNDPDEAIQYLKEETPDLIISDFRMPKMNGLEFLREAKKLHPEVSKILLTAYADKENAIKTINEIGIYKYLEKPWDNDDLIINIRNGIERSHLVSDLREKIEELEEAKQQLKVYNEQLETLVKERTKELSFVNQKLENIFNYCADGIIIIDKLGNIKQVNPACENIVGLDSKVICGKKIQELAYVDMNTSEQYHTRSLNNTILDLSNSESNSLMRNLYIKNVLSGENVPVEINFAQLNFDDCENECYVGVIRDFRQQKEAERLRDDFIATLTHDLRTPLLAAIQTLKFFLDGSLGSITEQQRILLSTMVQSNEDLLGLVNALLEVYKFESGKLTLCKTVFNIKDLLTQCHEELLPLATKKEITFSLHTENLDDIKIDADRSEIKRVIVNLYGNAINYTNKGGTIDIFAKIQSNDFLFSINDNGNGIPKEDIPNLFKRFSQGTTIKRSTGTGLGLYLSRKIIEAHGGKIWVDSKVSKGSEFSFLLTDVVVKESL